MVNFIALFIIVNVNRIIVRLTMVNLYNNIALLPAVLKLVYLSLLVSTYLLTI